MNVERKMSFQDFVDTYKDSIGVEAANHMLLETIQRLHLNPKEGFSKEECILICKDLQEKSGFVGIVAGILLARVGGKP